VFVLDMNTGKEKRLTSITIEPFSLFENRGIKLSPNGRYLSARHGRFLIVDWKEDRRLMEQNGYHKSEWFTPDGKRLVAACDTDFIQYVNFQRTTPVGGWLELYDVEKGVQIGKCVPQDHGMKDGITALAFSGDGKKFALADGKASVGIYDF